MSEQEKSEARNRINKKFDDAVTAEVDKWWNNIEPKRNAIRKKMAEKQKIIDARRESMIAAKKAEIDEERKLEAEALKKDITMQYNHDLVSDVVGKHTRSMVDHFSKELEKFTPSVLGDRKSYADMQDKLHALNDLLEKVAKDDNPLDRENVSNLKEAYEAVITSANTYLEGRKDELKLNHREARDLEINSMLSVVKKGRQALENAEIEKSIVLNQIVKEAEAAPEKKDAAKEQTEPDKEMQQENPALKGKTWQLGRIQPKARHAVSAEMKERRRAFRDNHVIEERKEKVKEDTAKESAPVRQAESDKEMQQENPALKGKTWQLDRQQPKTRHAVSTEMKERRRAFRESHNFTIGEHRAVTKKVDNQKTKTEDLGKGMN